MDHPVIFLALLMPHQRVPDHLHPMLLGEVGDLVGTLEGKFAALVLERVGLEFIAGGEATELLGGEFGEPLRQVRVVRAGGDVQR